MAVNKVARGKALVVKLRADPQVRDAEALAAWIGRFKKARKAGKSVAEAKKVAKGAGSGGGDGNDAASQKGSGDSGGKDAEITLAVYNRPGSPRTYVAEITGLGGKYGLEREFQQPSGRSRSGSGKTGNDKFKLKEGKVYEIAEGYKDRRYVKIENGEAVPVGKPGGARDGRSGSRSNRQSEGPTAAEVAAARIREKAAKPVPTSLPREWKDELAQAEKYPGGRRVLKNRALSMSKMAGIPVEAAIGKMLLEEIRKRNW